LIEAAQHWARCHLDDFDDQSAFIAQLYASGAPPEIIAEHEAEQAEEHADFIYNDDEAEIITLFLRLENRWQIVPTFGGLFYQGVDAAFAIKLLELRPPTGAVLDVIDDLLLMEAAAKAKLNEILNRRAEEKNGK